MIQRGQFNGYTYWVGYDKKKDAVYYNIAPTGQACAGGYYSKEYIMGIKKLPDLFG